MLLSVRCALTMKAPDSHTFLPLDVYLRVLLRRCDFSTPLTNEETCIVNNAMDIHRLRSTLTMEMLRSAKINRKSTPRKYLISPSNIVLKGMSNAVQLPEHMCISLDMYYFLQFDFSTICLDDPVIVHNFVCYPMDSLEICI